MTLRRVKRLRSFELSLEIKSDDFIAPPRESQRRWLVNRALTELSHDLEALDRVARRFVAGSDVQPPADRTHAALDEQAIMEDWQLPIMRAMAEEVARSHGDVLEVGFGRGVSAGYIQELGVASHTVVECNDTIVSAFESWRRRHPDRDIRLIHSRWQEADLGTERYDGVFFHTYPLDEEEFMETVVESTTFAEHFFPTAAAALREGGVFTYLTNEIDSLGREHQRRLFDHFGSLSLRVVRDLELPDSAKDAWWADSMAVVAARKG